MPLGLGGDGRGNRQPPAGGCDAGQVGVPLRPLLDKVCVHRGWGHALLDALGFVLEGPLVLGAPEAVRDGTACRHLEESSQHNVHLVGSKKHISGSIFDQISVEVKYANKRRAPRVQEGRAEPGRNRLAGCLLPG